MHPSNGFDRLAASKLGTSCPKAVLFDVDGTIAESFQPPKPEMVAKLAQLLAQRPVALITGASFERIKQDVLGGLPSLNGLYLFPNSSTECYVFEHEQWKLVYEMSLSAEDRARIKRAIEECIAEIPLLQQTLFHGERIIDRGSQVAFTITGWDAPHDLKKSWDPDGAKRRMIQAKLSEKLPDFDILLGGMVTIDITRKGINKTYGVRWLSRHLKIAPSDMLYIGDALYPGGNDFVVIETGIQTRATSGPEETLQIVEQLLTVCT